MANTVAQRTVEIGIRMALGATVGRVARHILATGVRLALAGSVLGLFGAVGIIRLFGSLMPGMAAGIVPVVAESALLLGLAALIASYLPARMAAGVDPMKAIRGE